MIFTVALFINLYHLTEKHYFYVIDSNEVNIICMHVLIFGATGTAGSEVVRQAIADPEVDKITLIVRKPFGFHNTKVNVIIRQDFLNYDDLMSVFREVNACIWCLGISQTQVSKAEYVLITYDYVVAAAKSMLSVNPDLAFVFLSGQGTDSTEKSRVLFARVKGKAENALKSLKFKYLYIFRPGVIVPMRKSPGRAWKYRLEKLIEWIAPQSTITNAQLAKVMLHMIKNCEQSAVFENREIRSIVEKHQYNK